MVINTSRDVTPHTGVWIETLILATRALSCSVTPHTGVWIETIIYYNSDDTKTVTPHTGVWIETPNWLTYGENIPRHPPYGGVD